MMCELGGQREGWPQKLGTGQGAVIFYDTRVVND